MIEIKKSVYNEVLSGKHESCGFIIGKDFQFDEIYPTRNIAKKQYRYKMSRKDLLSFIFHYMRSQKNQVIVYHIHNLSGDLSADDLFRMIPGLIYGIGFKDRMCFYRKNIFGDIFGLSHKFILENENGK